MLTSITKSFELLSAEGWVYSGTTSLGNGAWKGIRPQYKHGYSNLGYDFKTEGGTLRSFVFNTTTETNVTWIWTGTFEDLGVPTGSVVTNLTGDYLYRWFASRSHSKTERSNLQFAAGDGIMGKLQFYDPTGGGSLFDLSAAQPVPARGGAYGADEWQHYPYQQAQEFPISDTPNAWKLVNGTMLDLKTLYGGVGFPSNKTMNFIFHITYPPTQNYAYSWWQSDVDGYIYKPDEIMSSNSAVMLPL